MRNLSAPPAVRDVSFDLHRGEILGLGGLVGAGRSETVETLFGLRPRAGGEVRLDGRPFAPRRPAQAIRAGLGFVAEDRRRQSIVPDLSVRENLLLGHLGAHRGFGLGYGKLDRKIDELMARLELPRDRLADANLLEFLRRHAAEDHHRALAAAGAESADPRRADQGRRHRHARLDLRDLARHRGRRARRSS